MVASASTPTHAHTRCTRMRGVKYAISAREPYTMCCWLLCFWTRSIVCVYAVHVYYSRARTIIIIIIMWSVLETFEKILLLVPLSRINVVSPGAESPNEPSKALQRLHIRSAPRHLRRFIIRPTDVQTTRIFFVRSGGGMGTKKKFRAFGVRTTGDWAKTRRCGPRGETYPQRTASSDFIWASVDYYTLSSATPKNSCSDHINPCPTKKAVKKKGFCHYRTNRFIIPTLAGNNFTKK